MDKLTVKATEAVQRASELASERGYPELLPATHADRLLEDREGIVTPVLEKVGAAPQSVLVRANAALERLPRVSGASAQPANSSNISLT